MLHVYALLRHPASVPDLPGIDGAKLRAVTIEGHLDVVVSDATAGHGPTEEAILAHAAVVQALADASDGVLPARFAPGPADEEELRRRLADRAGELLDAIDGVAGCVELGLRALPVEHETASTPPSSGREYMQRRLDQVTGAERMARELHDSLDTFARRSTLQVPARRDLLLTAAYLVPRGAVERFGEAVARAQGAHPELTLVATGPWPPYSFALLDGEAT